MPRVLQVDTSAVESAPSWGQEESGASAATPPSVPSTVIPRAARVPVAGFTMLSDQHMVSGRYFIWCHSPSTWAAVGWFGYYARPATEWQWLPNGPGPPYRGLSVLEHPGHLTYPQSAQWVTSARSWQACR